MYSAIAIAKPVLNDIINKKINNSGFVLKETAAWD